MLFSVESGPRKTPKVDDKNNSNNELCAYGDSEHFRLIHLLNFIAIRMPILQMRKLMRLQRGLSNLPRVPCEQSDSRGGKEELE